MIDNNSYEEKLSDEKGLIKKISTLFQNEALSDVQLKVGDTKYFAHKFILSASSDVLSKLFDKKWKTSNKHLIVLEEHSECEKNFSYFLKFLYTGEVIFNNDRVIGLLCLADKYNVESLRNLALEYMHKNAESPHLMNALKWFSWVKLLNYKETVQCCWETICSNFQKLIFIPEIWCSLDIGFLCEILESSSIIVDCEYSIYELCKTWLYNDEHVSDIEQYARTILPLVRFSMMTPAQLFEIENRIDFSENRKIRKLLKSSLMKAHKYRSLCLFDTSINETFDDEWYKPRNYLSLVIDHFNYKISSRLSNSIDKKAIKTPYFSNELTDWKLTYRKYAEKLIVTFRSSNVPEKKLGLKVQFVLLAVNINEDALKVVHSIPVSMNKLIQESIEIDCNGKEDDICKIFVMIKVLIS